MRSPSLVTGPTGPRTRMLPPGVRALVRNVPTVAPVPHRSILSVTGSQAVEFLNGIISSSVPDHPQSHFYSAFLHAQGRVLYDAFFYAHPSSKGTPGYLIEYDARTSEAPPLLPMLKRYVLRSKVKLRDVSDEYDVWAAWGSEKEKSWETERRWDRSRSDVVEPVWDSEKEWPWGMEQGALRDRRAVGMGHRLLVRKGDRPQEAATHEVASPDDYLLHRILHGVPEGIMDIPPMRAFPMEANLDVMGAINFRKGCYVGQELTVRTYHTGVLRKRILPVAFHRPDSGSSGTASNSSDFPSFSSGLNIRGQSLQSSDEGVIQTRPRAFGKLLSSIKGVGLALLRLERVQDAQNGGVTFEVELEDEKKTKWGLTHWWPDWWPR